MVSMEARPGPPLCSRKSRRPSRWRVENWNGRVEIGRMGRPDGDALAGETRASSLSVDPVDSRMIRMVRVVMILREAQSHRPALRRTWHSRPASRKRTRLDTNVESAITDSTPHARTSQRPKHTTNLSTITKTKQTTKPAPRLTMHARTRRPRQASARSERDLQLRPYLRDEYELGPEARSAESAGWVKGVLE